MKKSFWVATLALLCLPLAHAESDVSGVTPLQLRDMQTRKFKKPMAEVVEGIKEGAADTGATCHVMPVFTPGQVNPMSASRTEVQCQLPLKVAQTSGAANAAAFIPFVGAFVAGGAAINQMQEQEKNFKQIGSLKYAIRSTSDGETIVRMRAYTHKQEQIKQPEVYAKQFKIVGDSLFVQAIELTPGEQE